MTGGALNVTITGSISGNGVKVRRTLANPIATGVVWGSVMVRANGAVVDGDFFVETAPVFDASVGKRWGTDFSLGNAGSDGNGANKTVVPGMIHIMLWKYDFGGSLASMWIDPPDQSSEVALGTPDKTWSGTIPTISTVSLGFQRYGNPDVDMDNFVLGTTLADVYNSVPVVAPPPPTPVSPTDGATSVLLDAQLQWTLSGATSWDLYLWKGGDAEPVAPTVVGATSSIYDPGTLDASTTYNWKVVAYNGNGSTPSDSTWTFTTGDGVVAVLPPSDATHVPLDLPLEWADNGATSWDIYLWKDGDGRPGSPTAAGLTEASYDSGGFDSLTLYHWEVVSHYSSGSPTTSTTFSFITSDGLPGQLLLREEFDGYGFPGTTIIGQTGKGMGETGDWSPRGGGNAATFNVVSPGLSGSNAVLVTGGAGDSDARITHTVAGWGSGVFYMSYLYNVTSHVGHSYVTGTGGFEGGFGLGWDTDWEINNSGFGVTFNPDQTYRLVAKVDFDNNTTTMWADAAYEFDAPVAFRAASVPQTPTLVLLNYQTVCTVDDIRIGTSFSSVNEPIAPVVTVPTLQVAINGNKLDFSWNNEEGMLYDLVSSPDLATPISTWPVVGANEAIPADISGTNILQINHPVASKYFYALAVYPQPPAVLLSEDFETDNGGFSYVDNSVGGAGTPWEWGTPDSDNGLAGGTITQGYDGSTKCWATGLGPAAAGVFNAATDASLRTPAIDLTTAAAASLRYANVLDIGFSDSAKINFLDATNPSIVLATVEILDDGGTTTPWVLEAVTVPAEALGKNIIIEWRLDADDAASFQFLGWYIDNVSVIAN